MASVGARTSADVLIDVNEVKKVLDNIKYGLDAINDKSDEYEYRVEELMLLEDQIQRVEGQSGTQLVYEDFEIFFQDGGMALSPQEYEEEYNKWTLHSKYYEIKDGSFTPDFFRKELKAGRNPLAKLEDKAIAIQKKYLNVFKPNIVWEALLTVPTAGGTYYEKFGALRDTTVKESMIEQVIAGAAAGEKGSLVRNHYRAIANATGVESADLQFIKEYFNEYPDVNVNDIVMVGSLGSENQLRKVFTDSITTDNIIVNGLPAVGIEGMPFVKTKMLPDNIIAFVVKTPDAPILAELTLPNEEFKGLNWIPEKSYKKYPEELEDLVNGSKYEISDIGYHFIGRHRVLFLDITPDAAHASADRIMKDAGIALITNKRKSLNRLWKSVVK